MGNNGLVFQSALPGRGATVWYASNHTTTGISIHAPREGSDPFLDQVCVWSVDFNPRSPGGERPNISVSARSLKYFNPRSPGGERLGLLAAVVRLLPFQSTLPGRGATHGHTHNFCAVAYFNPRSPGGERLEMVHKLTDTIKFQSTLPGRGATGQIRRDHRRDGISIHAPREGSDAANGHPEKSRRNFNPRSPGGERRRRRRFHTGAADFNPRSPGGERLLHHRRGLRNLLFQSTLPGRGATVMGKRVQGNR